jgi:hypothetical protein
MIQFFKKEKTRSGFCSTKMIQWISVRSGYKIGLIYSVPDFGITKLNLKFINPVTRKNELHEMMLGEITERNKQD